jgi:hypothetical protein
MPGHRDVREIPSILFGEFTSDPYLDINLREEAQKRGLEGEFPDTMTRFAETESMGYLALTSGDDAAVLSLHATYAGIINGHCLAWLRAGRTPTGILGDTQGPKYEQAVSLKHHGNWMRQEVFAVLAPHITLLGRIIERAGVLCASEDFDFSSYYASEIDLAAHDIRID